MRVWSVRLARAYRSTIYDDDPYDQPGIDDYRGGQVMEPLGTDGFGMASGILGGAPARPDPSKDIEVGVRYVRDMQRQYERALQGSQFATPQDALESLGWWADRMEKAPKVVLREDGTWYVAGP